MQGSRHPLLVGGVEQAGGDGAHLGDVEPAAVDAAALVARQAEVHAGHRRDGARGAEQVRVAATEPLAQPVLGLERRQQVDDVADHGLEHVAVDEPAAEALGQRDDADRQRGPGGDAALHLEPLRQRAPPLVLAARQVEPDQLGGAAADVEHQREIAAEVDQRGAAGDGQLGLGLAVDDA